MKFIIPISTTIRTGNYPRVDGFEYSQEYGKYLYLGRELDVLEFNASAKVVFSETFRDQGYKFGVEAIGDEVVAAQEEADAAALAESERQRAEAEEHRQSAIMAEEAITLNVPADTGETIVEDEPEQQISAPDATETEVPESDDAETLTDADPVPDLDDEFAVPDDDEIPATATPTEEKSPEAPVFRLEGKGIFVGDQRVGGIFGSGESQHVRMEKENAELRPQVIEWFNSLPQ